MATLQESEQSLKSYQDQLAGYDTNLPGAINEQITKAWTPAFQEATGVLGKKLEGFLPGFFNVPYEGMNQGTSEASVSPQYKLNQMGQQHGILSSGLSQAANYVDFIGAKRDEMYNKALEAMKMGYQTAADAYSREFQKYQLAWEAAENEKNRALQRSMAGGAGSGGTLEDYLASLAEQNAAKKAAFDAKVAEARKTSQPAIDMANKMKNMLGKFINPNNIQGGTLPGSGLF